MKSAAVKIGEFLNECRDTRDLLKEFVDASRENHGSYDYAAGYLESLMVDILMELPRARRQQFREQLNSKIKTYKMSVEA